MEHVQQSFKLSVPSDTQNLAMIRDFVERAAKRTAIESKALDSFKLAVDEACANVIEHAYQSDSTKELTIRVSYSPTELAVEVIDSGAASQGESRHPIPAARGIDGSLRRVRGVIPFSVRPLPYNHASLGPPPRHSSRCLRGHRPNW